jgi:hypothetical protein
MRRNFRQHRRGRGRQAPEENSAVSIVQPTSI